MNAKLLPNGYTYVAIMRIILTKIKKNGLLEFSIMVLENFSTCFQDCETALGSSKKNISRTAG